MATSETRVEAVNENAPISIFASLLLAPFLNIAISCALEVVNVPLLTFKVLPEPTVTLPVTSLACKFVTCVVDATVKGAVPVATSETRVWAVNLYAPISTSAAAPSTIALFCAAEVVNVPFCTFIVLPEPTVTSPSTELAVPVKAPTNVVAIILPLEGLHLRFDAPETSWKPPVEAANKRCLVSRFIGSRPIVNLVAATLAPPPPLTWLLTYASVAIFPLAPLSSDNFIFVRLVESYQITALFVPAAPVGIVLCASKTNPVGSIKPPTYNLPLQLKSPVKKAFTPLISTQLISFVLISLNWLCPVVVYIFP